MANGNPFRSVKADVVNEYRNDLYYNQIEIERQFKLAASGGENYKQCIREIQALLKVNSTINSALALLDAMVPNEQPAPPVAESPVQPAE